MKHQIFICLISLVLIFSCEEELVIDTDKNVFNDDIADITELNGYFFTTNHDRSGHAGSQIDLLKFESEGDHIFLSDRFELELNGQGYMAIANDDTNLFLSSPTTDLMMKYSPVGENAYLTYDDISSDWHSGGLAYNAQTDSLLVLYRNSVQTNLFRMRSHSKNISGEVSLDEQFQLNCFDPSIYGVYAMEYHDSQFYLLGIDTLKQDVLVKLNNQYSVVSIDTLSDSTVVGLCFKDNDLFLSYRDKRIAMYSSIE